MINGENVHAFEVFGQRWFIRYSREMPTDDDGHRANVLVDYDGRTITAWANLVGMPRDCVAFIVEAVCLAWSHAIDPVES